ncbi:MAG: hypothetical protein QM696_01890 [Steroidobacteraceae bacterium]
MSVNPLTPLDELTVLEARGPDAVRFLQGQLSQDLRRLDQGGHLLAGLHNPQGRLLALLRLLQRSPDQVLLVLPASVAEPVRQLLSRYVLRAKVVLTAAGSTWRVCGASGPDADAIAATHLHMPAGGGRQLVVAPRDESVPEADLAARQGWRLGDITNGIPEIGAELSGAFVAQMLNLDLLDAISFSKGCYTGQEVIARAHYRGQVKRRMQRFGTAWKTPLAPGERLHLADGRALQVVMAAPGGLLSQEFLAVGPMAATTAPAPTQADDETPLIDAVPLPLPYELPA